MNFSPTDIAYFLAVVEQGHVGRAAQTMGVSQPAVSKAIRRLESSVGVTLFERGAHGVRPTTDGRLFLESARRFDSVHAQMVRSAEELRAHNAGLLRIGLTNPNGDSDPILVLAEMVRRRPGMRLVLTIGKSDRLNAAVECGELDAAIVPSYPGISFSCSQTVVHTDKVQVAARAGHPLFGSKDIDLRDLGEHFWAMPSRDSASRTLLERLFKQAGVATPRVAVEAEYMSEAVMGILSHTDLLAMVPASVLRGWFGRVNPLPLRALEVQRMLVLLTRPDVEWTPLLTNFRDLTLARRATDQRT